MQKLLNPLGIGDSESLLRTASPLPFTRRHFLSAASGATAASLLLLGRPLHALVVATADELSKTVRFIHLFNYTEGVSKADGENWYLNTHVPQARKLPGIVRFRSWPGIDVGIPFPSAGAPTPHTQFVRRSEIAFSNLSSAIGALKNAAGLFAPAAKGEVGFREFECMLLAEVPQYDLLRDAPPQHYPYMTKEMSWPKGPPEFDDNAEIFIDSYCIAYAPQVTLAAGEDWYLGHHTREGKQLPGMKHYKTWRTIQVAESLPPHLDLNKWLRLTELGMSPEAFKATMVNNDTRIRFTQPARGRVIGRWLNIDIKLDQFEDLLSQG